MNWIDEIRNYNPFNEQEKQDKKVALDYITTFPNILTRENEFAHMTASSWIVNKDRTKVLMIFHNIYQSWAWTGGHADGEDNLLNVAIRETMEETGIKNIKPLQEDIFSLELLCVDGHVKRGKYVSSHIHINVTYLLEADESEALAIKEDENSGVRWIDIDDAVQISNEQNMKVVYTKLNKKLKSVTI
ncbi:ADP-ribose pyrophosphatase YjhB, NUDIX family [Anaerosporobacter mobilis DSM 15930]|jgi:8-oxo-dGTP pyrophosphatase MutT (NUDIX family)|uniref:ADP-ribose pyrophosphatase YjhB, NUDIX family n=1 Tax=Anaerosporobacter mobilis DSM 15930 TaxID=1120996 RepID=A0A1M7KGP6_9FIRM|nr:NUDIX hydrolase [Anaerosporobacter mobilis]SHM64268.1 ADP-ribose pyrophosphatase YjhB, NUDIX family [Anaerosporobacter mobilis DSM 15930]